MKELQTPNEQQAQALLDQAMAASQSGAVEEAIRLFREAAHAQPGVAVPLFLLAAELAQSGAMQEAEQAYAGALLLAPELHTARFQLGLLQFSSNRAAQALLTWQPLLSVGDEAPWPHFVRGFGALAADQFAEAITFLEAGIACNAVNPPLNADIRLVIQRVTELLNQPSQAEVLESAKADESDEEAAHLLLANYRQSPLH